MGQHCSFQLLAPPNSTFTDEFARSFNHQQLHGHYLAAMQKLRGSIYLKDRAIRPCELDDEGRFHMQADEQSWHLLLLDQSKAVIGCARYLVHSSDVSYNRLRISQTPLAKSEAWGGKVRRAVEADLRRVRDQGLAYVEVGGWALAEEWRGTRAALEILVGSYALGQIWGGCVGSCTATIRHSSSSMLRRIGGESFTVGDETLPAYDDPNYDCRMELLRFDYRSPAKRFLPLIHQLKTTLSRSTVVTNAPHPLPLRLGDLIPEQPGLLHLTPLLIA
jgi:predicted GNAT family N-acyltransferase